MYKYEFNKQKIAKINIIKHTRFETNPTKYSIKYSRKYIKQSCNVNVTFIHTQINLDKFK